MQKKTKNRNIIFLLNFIVFFTSCNIKKMNVNDYFQNKINVERKSCKEEYERFLVSVKKVTDSVIISTTYSDNCEEKIFKYDVFRKNSKILIDSVLEKNADRYIILNREYIRHYNGVSKNKTILIDTYSANFEDKYSTYDEDSKKIINQISNKEMEYLQEIEKYITTKKSKILSKTEKTFISYYVINKENDKIKIMHLYCK